MSSHLFRTMILATILTTLLGCQANKTKPMEPEDQTIDTEMAAFAWTQLQQATLDNLREKSFGEAELNIQQLMAYAGEDPEKWEYIRMAMVSMPIDLAADLVAVALKNNFIDQSTEQQFSFSRVLTQIKQEQQALDLINQVIKRDKQEAYVYWRARLYLLLEDEERAEKDYVWLLKQDSENPDYISQYATLLSFLNRDDEAIALLLQHEQDADLVFRQIILLLQQNQTDQAKEKFTLLKQLADVESLDAEQKLEIGELAFWLEDLDYSMSLLQTVKSGDQVNAAKLLIGNILVAQKEFDRAAVVYHQVQNGPEEHAIPAYQLEIDLYRQQNDFEQAMEVANLGLSMFKDDPNILYSRAMLFEKLDDMGSLERDLMKILKDDPENALAMNALGYTWADRDMNLDEAYDYIMRAHAIEPEDKAILDSVGWIYYKKGDLELAEKYLKMAVKDNERDLESYEHLLIVLEELGKADEAANLKTRIQELFEDSL